MNNKNKTFTETFLGHLQFVHWSVSISILSISHCHPHTLLHQNTRFKTIQGRRVIVHTTTSWFTFKCPHMTWVYCFLIDRVMAGNTITIIINNKQYKIQYKQMISVWYWYLRSLNQRPQWEVTNWCLHFNIDNKQIRCVLLGYLFATSSATKSKSNKKQ